MTDQISIAEDLRDRDRIRECELICYTLHKRGHTFYAIRAMMLDTNNPEARGHSASTLWRWYQRVQRLVETEEDYEREGEPTATMTIERGGEAVAFHDAVVAFALGMRRTYWGKRRGKRRAVVDAEAPPVRI